MLNGGDKSMEKNKTEMKALVLSDKGYRKL